MVLKAPAKINLCLYLGSGRCDGLHRLVTAMEPLELADEIEVLHDPDQSGDRVEFAHAGGGGGAVSAGMVSELATSSTVHAALAAAREAGWSAPPCTVRVTKRIPSGAGLGGGSADAAAVLRWIGADSGGSVPVSAIAMQIGADVPSQLQPVPCLVTGAGEVVEPLEGPDRHAIVLVTSGGRMDTGAVFAEADRLGLGRSASELDELETSLRAAGGRDLLYRFADNDLEPAALSLRPELARAFDELAAAGAERVSMSGSGATVFGIFDGAGAARQAAEALDRSDVLVTLAGDGEEAPEGAP